MKLMFKSMLLFWFCFVNCLPVIRSSRNDTVEIVDDTVRLKVGSMLNVSCTVNDECLLKNSYCSPLTRRCECDRQTMENGSLCQVIYCSSSAECQARYPNTVCNYGHCQCQYGLKANGQCITGAFLPGPDPSSQNGSLAEMISKLPDWSFPAILVGAVLSGVLGSRSPFFSQIFHHILAIVVLIGGAVKRASTAGTSIPVQVVADVVEELVDIPLRDSHNTVKPGSGTTGKRTADGTLESCHHVHEIQLNCDPQNNV